MLFHVLLLLISFIAPSLCQVKFDCPSTLVGTTVEDALRASLNSASTSSQNVLEINCNNLGITGGFPSSISGIDYATNFSELVTLSFANGDLTGSVPSEIALLAKLTTLDISGNQFSNGLPTNLGLLSDLKALNVGFNKLIGAIPAQIGFLPLTILDVQSNSFTSIPDEALPGTLVLFVANQNDFAGTIPTALSQARTPSLTEVQLSDSGFSVVSSELLSLQNLQLLDLSINFINQQFSSFVGDINGLGELTKLDISKNEFRGTIPVDFFLKLTSLESLNMANNKLGGTFPSEIGRLTKLKTLFAGGNNFTGIMPRHTAIDTDTPVGLDFLTGVVVTAAPTPLAPTSSPIESNLGPRGGVIVGAIFGLGVPFGIILTWIKWRTQRKNQQLKIMLDVIDDSMRQQHDLELREQEKDANSPPSIRYTMQTQPLRDTMRTALSSLHLSAITGPSIPASQEPPPLPARFATPSTAYDPAELGSRNQRSDHHGLEF